MREAPISTSARHAADQTTLFWFSCTVCFHAQSSNVRAGFEENDRLYCMQTLLYHPLDGSGESGHGEVSRYCGIESIAKVLAVDLTESKHCFGKQVFTLCNRGGPIPCNHVRDWKKWVRCVYPHTTPRLTSPYHAIPRHTTPLPESGCLSATGQSLHHPIYPQETVSPLSLINRLSNPPPLSFASQLHPPLSLIRQPTVPPARLAWS